MFQLIVYSMNIVESGCLLEFGCWNFYSFWAFAREGLARKIEVIVKH